MLFKELLSQAVEKLTPVLAEYASRLKATEDGIRLKGTISLDICAKCSLRNIVSVEKLGTQSSTGLDALLKWLKDNEVREIASTGKAIEFRSAKNELEGVKGTKITLFEGTGLGLAPRTEKLDYDYRIPLGKLKSKPFASLLMRPLSGLRLCGHVSNLAGVSHLAYVTTTARESMFDRHQRVEDLWERGETDQRYDLLCEECFRRIDSIGCEESIRKEGFTFVHRCPTQKIVFESLLEKHGIKYVSGQSERLYVRGDLMAFLPDLGVFASDSLHGLPETVEALKPDSILAFAKKQTLPKFLQFGTNVILFDPETEKEPMLVFDRNTTVEKSDEAIINAVLEKLDDYSSQIRGKEHDKLIAAFERLGKELGFIPQTEMSQKGARVDIVWLGDKGKVEVAIEVETSAQWKKDIVTTWESSPRLAIVLAHFKTDKAVEDIVQYSLLQHMPHKLLFIGYIQKKAYLIEKGVIVKSYYVKSAA